MTSHAIQFLDEDLPMATPAQVNAVAPLPVVVTFQ